MFSKLSVNKIFSFDFIKSYIHLTPNHNKIQTIRRTLLINRIIKKWVNYAYFPGGPMYQLIKKDFEKLQEDYNNISFDIIEKDFEDIK